MFRFSRDMVVKTLWLHKKEKQVSESVRPRESVPSMAEDRETANLPMPWSSEREVSRGQCPCWHTHPCASEVCGLCVQVWEGRVHEAGGSNGTAEAQGTCATGQDGPDTDCPSPSSRLSLGQVRGRLTLRTRPGRQGGIAGLCIVKNNTLTIRAESKNQGAEQDDDDELVLAVSSMNHAPGTRALWHLTEPGPRQQLEVNKLAITVLPKQYDLFYLSSQDECTAPDLPQIRTYCYAKDQEARNQWIAVLRRMPGVEVCAECDAGRRILSFD